MAGAKEMHQLARDWANGARTIDVLWEAYAYGMSDGYDQAVQDAQSES